MLSLIAALAFIVLVPAIVSIVPRIVRIAAHIVRLYAAGVRVEFAANRATASAPRPDMAALEQAWFSDPEPARPSEPVCQGCGNREYRSRSDRSAGHILDGATLAALATEPLPYTEVWADYLGNDPRIPYGSRVHGIEHQGGITLDGGIEIDGGQLVDREIERHDVPASDATAPIMRSL